MAISWPTASVAGPRRLTRLYIAALTAVAMLSLAGQWVIQGFLARQTSDSTVINIAGRQRMLSQKISKAALALAASTQESKQRSRLEELRESLALWEQCHRGLQLGDDALGLPGDNSNEVSAQFAALETTFQALQTAAGNLRDGGDPKAAVYEILQHEGQFLERMDAIVSQYEREAQQHVARLQFIERSLFGLTLAVLLLEGLLVFRPAVRHIQSTLQALAETGEQLRKAKDAAEAASQAKSRLLANTSHELRTPLHAILGMTEQLAGEPLMQWQAEQLAIVRSSAVTLLQLVSDLLDAAAIEAGKLKLHTKQVHLRGLVEHAAAILRASLNGKPLSIETQIAEDVPDCVVTAGLRLKQVLLNLGGNAIKFTDRGSVTIRLDVVQRDAASAVLRCAVIDTGIGLPETERDAAFEPFMQLKDNRAAQRGGIGLGLTICRHITRLLGGEMHVRSEVGKGSEFYFTLPVTIAAKASLDEGHSVDSLQFQGQRILVVDDAPVNRQLASLVLQRAGCDVATASDGPEALALLETQWFDAALLDLRLPGMNGCELAEAMRQLALAFGRRPIPIVALTADGKSESLHSAWFQRLVLKPADSGAILSAVGEVLSHDSMGTPLGRLHGDAQLLDELKLLFLDEAPQILGDIDRSLESNDRQSIRLAAHRIRGQALQLGLAELATAAEHVESQSSDADVDLLASLIMQIHARIKIADPLTPHY